MLFAEWTSEWLMNIKHIGYIGYFTNLWNASRGCRNHDCMVDLIDLIFWCLMPLSWQPVLVVEEAGVPGEYH